MPGKRTPVELAALIRAFEPKTLERGMAYARSGRVMSVDMDTARGLISGRVRGTGRKLYQTIVRLSTGADGRVEVVGQCSCPVGFNCKHAAALVLASGSFAQEPQGSDGSEPSGLPSAGAKLPSDVEGWLVHCETVAERVARDDPQRLIYVLAPQGSHSVRGLKLAAFKTRPLKSGGWSKPQEFRIASQSSAAFVTAEDRRIMALAEQRAPGSLRSGESLSQETGADVVRALAASGRGHWLDASGPVLHDEGPLDARLEWRLGEDARLRVELDGAGPGLLLLPLTPPWYLDPESGACGPIRCGLGDQEAALLAMAPEVSVDAAETLGRLAQGRLKGLDLPLPPRPKRRRLKRERPTPRLRLYSEDLSASAAFNHWGASREPQWSHYAVLDFLYGDVAIDPRDEPGVYVQLVDGELVERERVPEAESGALARLSTLGFESTLEMEERGGPWLDFPEEMDWIAFMRDAAPVLAEDGWRIEPQEGFRFVILYADDWELDVDEGEGGHWFDLGLGVEVNGESIDLLPVLLDLASQSHADLSPRALAEAGDGADLPVRLPDGRMILMPLARLRPMLATLVELYDPQQRLTRDKRLRLPRIQAAQLAELEAADPGLAWRGGDAARDWGRRLRDFSGITEVEPPADLKAELRHYQRQGLDWLQFLREYQLGGILADDMGLGKTVQSLAHLLLEKVAGRADRPSLVIAPTTLMFNWRREAERFAPDLSVLLLHGVGRKERFNAIPDHDLVLTTYPLLPRDLKALSEHAFHLLILDEAQAIKNPKSKAAQAARAIRARHRLCLTGTPLENHLGELWSIFDFLMPEMLGDERRFRRLFRTPIERDGDAARQESLRQRVAPFLLRRTKETVAKELPPKTEILREVPLAQDQRDLYETLRLAMHERVRAEVKRRGLAQSGIVILDALLKLRQVCCDPRLVSLPSAKRVDGSAKLELLMTLLPELLEEGRRILLFSQFTSMLALIEEALAAQGTREGGGYVKLTGRTKKRDEPVDRFQSGEVPLFLISLKAGGSGLNLTAADTVIHYDPWWNPAAERQATDRAHRIGQDKPVFVYKLLTEGTVEQRVAELQARKQALADAMLAGGGAAAGALSAHDLDLLFAPIDD